VLSPTSVEAGGGGSSRRPPGFGGGDDEGGGGGGEEEEMAKMSFLDHLVELRQRLIRCLIAVAVGFFACFGFAEEILDYLSQPAYQALTSHHQEPKLVYLHPTDIFNIYLQIGLICGLILVLPYVAGQVWGFISPGLYKREKKYAVPFVLVVTGLFLTGAGFGYYIALPFALKFLLGLGGPHVLPMIAVEEYLSLFTVLILGLGCIFEMPILIVILTALHIVTPKFLLDNFRYAILIITILAAVITPTTDIPNMMLFAIPMVGLYLLGVLFSKLVIMRREKHKNA
jgi:sec-independent protein translocase protein TatC